MANQLLDLRQYGQSVWYDFISRQLLASGELLRSLLVEAYERAKSRYR